ncbi:hypothetical protein RPMA_14645 [Tardiphaga alba]|uniref:Uncharacterized protein n=1 Tax=Tardiphaga alba TaxID=340268 RepID=A0ABX8A8X9_9BRAD|nr:hypothetical protein [Tardiphaga alba]QUS39932.1 hypothetical protein RPMA_14645 [Tardiphaga alba]
MMIELLIATCSLAGLAIGLVFSVRAIALTTVAMAIFAASMSWSQDFGMLGGIALTTGCLVACQLSYLAGRAVTKRYGFPDLLAGDEIDGDPGEPSQRSVANQDPERDPPPSGPASPKP